MNSEFLWETFFQIPFHTGCVKVLKSTHWVVDKKWLGP